MEHPRIDDNKIIDHYLVGQLSPDDEAAFEEHLFECTDCLEKVQWGEELRRGLRTVATEDTARATVALGWMAWLRQLGSARRAGLASLALLVTLLPAVVLWQQVELAQLRSRAAGSSALTEPIGDLAVLSMGVVRDAEPVEVRVDPEKAAVLLSLELPRVDADRYRVTLVDVDGSVQWRGDDLEPSLYDTLMVILPSTYLVPGSYRITIEAMSSAGASSAGELEFRVVSSM